MIQTKRSGIARDCKRQAAKHGGGEGDSMGRPRASHSPLSQLQHAGWPHVHVVRKFVRLTE